VIRIADEVRAALAAAEVERAIADALAQTTAQRIAGPAVAGS
jgi:hypothetical protein